MTEKLFNPDYLQHLCQKYGLRPSKKYGQNFLIEPMVIEEILKAAEIEKKETVVEVGPGFGALTFALLEKAGKVTAFEIEKKLTEYWQERQSDNLQIVWGDVLRNLKNFDLPEKYKVVANLPYQITSSVIRAFLESENPPESMILMIQKEVAERICAKPGDMSLLSVAVQYYAEPQIVAAVPRINFWPTPKVDSAVIKILKNKTDEAGDKGKTKEFFQLVKVGFANRRKFLIKNLLSLLGKKKRGEIQRVFKELNLSEKVRAQELSVEQWKKLSLFLFHDIIM